MAIPYDLILLASIVFALTFSLTYLFTLALVKTLPKRGSVVEDYHKPSKPKVAWPGGPAILSSILIAELILYFIYGDLRILSIALVTMIAGMIGLIDDKWRLNNGMIKPVSLILASLPILLLDVYVPRPTFPIFGSVRLYYVYPILVLAAIPIVSNATNMIDVLNGALSGFMIITTIPLVFALMLRTDYNIIMATIPLIASSLAFYIFHRYPSKIFPGDSGSLALGAIFCVIAIVGRVEIVAIISILPAILNSFFILSSVKKLIEHRSIKTRPTILLPNGQLAASKETSAPVTLVRMILADGPLSEREVVSNIFKLSAFSASLAVIMALATPW
ncbi:MAG: UDP-N-acetylglucosamine-1-phosphate transferase [archaeon]|nr:UDP-N-acetylglucosamine-1-phosphate transferase [archaeon]MCP8320286.1 UDP-N-acetylglucosamine-1-phosphate transferase [archaeon]